MDLYFNKEGEPITVHEWASLTSNDAYRKVAFDKIIDTTVSTVWVGLNTAMRRGVISIFETMVFGGVLDQESKRYGTLKEAEEGHAATVETVKRLITYPSLAEEKDE